MHNVKIKMIKQNTLNIDRVLSVLEEVITPKHYEAVMDSNYIKEGIAFFNFELGPDKLRHIYSHYTYLFLDFMEEAGKISRYYQMVETTNQKFRVSPIGSLLSTLAMKDIDDLSFGEHITEKVVTQLTNKILKRFDVSVISSELRSAIRREVRQHVASSTINGRYYSRRSKLVMHVVDLASKSLYSVK